MLASKQAGLKQRVKHIHWTNTLELRTHFSQFSSTFGSDHLLVWCANYFCNSRDFNTIAPTSTVSLSTVRIVFSVESRRGRYIGTHDRWLFFGGEKERGEINQRYYQPEEDQGREHVAYLHPHPAPHAARNHFYLH